MNSEKGAHTETSLLTLRPARMLTSATKLVGGVDHAVCSNRDVDPATIMIRRPGARRWRPPSSDRADDRPLGSASVVASSLRLLEEAEHGGVFLVSAYIRRCIHHAGVAADHDNSLVTLAHCEPGALLPPRSSFFSIDGFLRLWFLTGESSSAIAVALTLSHDVFVTSARIVEEPLS